MLEDTSTIVLGERLEDYVRGKRAILEVTSTLLLEERLEGNVKGH